MTAPPLRLTIERERLGFSKAKLSRLAELDASTLSKIEQGRVLPYAPELRRLAKALRWKADPLGLLRGAGRRRR